MPETSPPPHPIDRARIELYGLGRAIIPMPEDNGRKAAKAVALILVVGWSIIMLGLSFPIIPTVEPPHFYLYTAVVFALVGKLWDVEVKTLLGGK